MAGLPAGWQEEPGYMCETVCVNVSFTQGCVCASVWMCVLLCVQAWSEGTGELAVCVVSPQTAHGGGGRPAPDLERK